MITGRAFIVLRIENGAFRPQSVRLSSQRSKAGRPKRRGHLADRLILNAQHYKMRFQADYLLRSWNPLNVSLVIPAVPGA